MKAFANPIIPDLNRVILMHGMKHVTNSNDECNCRISCQGGVNEAILRRLRSGPYQHLTSWVPHPQRKVVQLISESEIPVGDFG